MNKFHVTIAALLVGGAAVLGAVAVARTTGLGSAAQHANDAAVASQTRQLAAFAAKLRRELEARPPALPKVPKQPPAATHTAATPRIVYHRPPPIVHVIHHYGDGGSEAEGGGGGDG